MTVTIDQDLKDILNKLDQKFDKIDQKFDKIDQKLDKIEQKFDQKIDNLQKDVVELKMGQIRLEEKIEKVEIKLEDKIEKIDIKLSEKVDGLAKRIDNAEFIARAIVIGIGVIILGGAAKLFGFFPIA